MRCRIYIIIAAICLCYGFEDSKCHAQDREYLSNSYYGKHIVKVFKLIKDNKLLKAEETMIELSEKYDKERDKQKVIEYPYIYDSVSKLLDPVWQIAECLIYNNKNATGEKISRQYNPWGAYLIYLNATKSDNENLLISLFR